MKKLLAVLLVIMTALSLVPTALAAKDSEQVDSVEIVLLLDVSGSMKSADPINKSTGSRVSIEASQQFVFNYPSETAMYVKVIPYNDRIYTGFESVNVSTAEGLDTFTDYMKDILEDPSDLEPDGDDHIDDFGCWVSTTNIGGAMDAAASVLTGSDADRKAVILFTDGKIEMSDDDAEEESYEMSEAAVKALEENGIPRYCIGLNKGNSVDKEFLKGISDSDDTIGKTTVVTEASELNSVFQEIYTYLINNSMLDEEVEELEVTPDVPNEKDIRIYGQAVKEANISLASKAPINTIKVTTPSGLVVADANYEKDDVDIDEEYCVINITPSRSTATIKLLTPMDGDWNIAITGEKSSVMLSKIYLFDLKLHHDISTDKAYVDDVFNFSTTIYNAETDVHVSSTGLYEGLTGAVASANVVHTGTKESSVYPGKLNSTSNGYNFDVEFSTPGKYKIDMTIAHKQFEIDARKTVEVLAPRLDMSSEKHDGVNSIKLTMVNPITNETVASTPAYLKGTEGTITLKSGDKVVHEETFDIDDVKDGVYSYTFDSLTAGLYTAKATFKGYDTLLETEEVSVAVDPSKITMNGSLTDKVTKSALSPEFTAELSLTDVFADSDGDKLTYNVSVPEESGLTAVVEDGTLKITSTAFGKNDVTLTVTDGKGAEYTHTVSVTVKSLVGLVVALSVTAAVVIVALVIFLIIVNKQKVVRFGFRVKITENNDDRFTEAVFSVGRLASNRHAKPTMALNTLLSSANTFSQLISSDFDDAALESIVSGLGGITVTGVPFKRAFKITVNGRKRGTFTRSQIRCDLADKGLTVVFGSVNDFNDTDMYGF